MSMIINPYIFGGGYLYYRLNVSAVSAPGGEMLLNEIALMISGADQIPTMTGATTNGVTMSASSEYGAGYEAWRAGDKNASIYLDTGAAAGPWWVKVQFASALFPCRHQICPSNAK